MDDINIPGNEPASDETKESATKFKFKKPRPLVIAIIIAVVVAGLALYFLIPNCSSQ